MKRLLSLVTLAVFTTASVCAAQDYGGLEEAVEALERGKLRKHRISAAVLAEAISSVLEADAKELDQAVKIAKEAKGDQALARALAERFLDYPSEESGILRYMGGLDREKVFKGVKDLSDWVPALLEFVDAKAGSAPHYVLTLLTIHAPGSTISELLTRWGQEDPSPPHLRPFLLGLRGSHRPALEVLQGVLPAELPEELAPARNSLISSLVEDLEAARYALKLMKNSQVTPALYGSLASFPPQLSKEVHTLITERLKTESGEVLSHLIRCAARLRVAEAFPLIVAAGSDGDENVQIAALTAFPSIRRHLERNGSSKTQAADNQLLDGMESAIVGALSDRGEVLATAIACASAMRLGDEDLSSEALCAWAADKDQLLAVRRAALGALRSSELDRPTATVLVALLSDAKVSRFAYATLKGMSKIRLPANQVLWQRWLKRARFDDSSD